MSREKAKEILDDNMSECTSHHVQKMDHLEQWVIDAMIEYEQNQAKNNDALDLVSKRNEVNLVVFEEYTRCYKVTDSELENLIKEGDIEEGDTVCKAVVIKDY